MRQTTVTQVKSNQIIADLIEGFKRSPTDDDDDEMYKSYIIPPYARRRPAVLPRLFNLAAHNGIRVKYPSDMHEYYGQMELDNMTMKLRTDDVGVFYHELAHYYDLRDRPEIIYDQDATQETVAELVAHVLAKMYDNVDTSAYTRGYITYYADGDKDRAARRCLQVIYRVNNVLNQIMADAEEVIMVEGVDDVIDLQEEDDRRYRRTSWAIAFAVVPVLWYLLGLLSP